MRKILLAIECVILALGVIISTQGTIEAVRFSNSYIPYFGLALLGVAFVALLIYFREKRLSWLIGVFMIVVYLFAGGAGYFNCTLNAGRLKRLENYKGKKVIACVGDTCYRWTGEVSYSGDGLEPRMMESLATITVGNDSERLTYYFVDPADPDTIYYQIYGGATGDYLILKKGP